MITKLLFSALIMALGAKNLLTQCVQSDEPALKAVSKGANRFANNFFKVLVKSERENFVCSPLGVGIVLSMTNMGAGGTTEKQLESVLSLPSDKTVTKCGFQELIDSLNNVEGAELNLANGIFTGKTYPPKPEFLNVLKTYFKSEAESVDFEKPVEAARIINNWSANKTNNRINKLFEADDLKGDTVMVLANAVHFKGKWEHKFDPDRTTLAPFYTDEKNWKNVPMMHTFGDYKWGLLENINAKFIELPFQSKSFEDAISMVIVRPNNMNELQKIADQIDKIDLGNLTGYYDNVNLYMPKFKIESEFDLKPILEKMGITEIFKNTANLTGVIEGPPVKVSKIIQKAFIEVNEEGSEAAAATGLIERPLSAPFLLEMNTPFIATIVSKTTGTVLFRARIINPTF